MQWEAVGGRLGVAVCVAMGLGLGALAWRVNATQATPAEPQRPPLSQPAPTRALPTTEAMQQSLAQAEPLLAMLRAGMVLSDDAIVGADVGLVEPLLLAHATHQRDVVALAVAHEEAGGALPLEQLLSPAALGSPAMRAALRVHAAQRASAAASYTQQLQAAGANARLRLQAALQAMPAGCFDAALQDFDADHALLAARARAQQASARDAEAAIGALLDVIDRARDVRVIQGRRGVELQFRSAAALQAYQRHLGAAQHAFEREHEHDARFAGTPLHGASFIRWSSSADR